MQRRFILFQPVSPGTNWGSGWSANKISRHTMASTPKNRDPCWILAAGNKVLIASSLVQASDGRLGAE